MRNRAKSLSQSTLSRQMRLRYLRAAALAALAQLAQPASSGAQEASAAPQAQGQPPTGEALLPQTPPPTGQQAPVPAPALPRPKPEQPRRTSPGLSQLTGKVRVQPLTLSDAVALSLATNRSLELASEALLRAQGRAQEQRASFNPTVAGTFTYTRLDQGNTASFGGQTITLVNQNQKQLGLQATLPLDISGLLRAATDQARFQEVAARLDVNRTLNLVVLNVKSAFYDVLRAQALVRVNTENLQNSLDRLRDTQLKLQAGTLTRFDVLRAQTDVANAQQQLISARNNVSLSVAALNNVIGININTPTQVTETGAVETPPGVAPPETPQAPPLIDLPENQPEPPAPDSPEANQEPVVPPQRPPLPVTYDALELGPDYDAVQQEALATRPEVYQAEANIAAARQGIRIANRSYLPALNVNWGFLYAPDSGGFAPQTTSWQANIQLSFPLYDGGVARARVRQARADIATAETNRRQAVDLVTLEVRQAYLNLVQARNRVAVANQTLTQAREAFRLARVRFQAGVAAQAGLSPLLELSDAQAALTQAESNQVNALYDYNNARSQLDQAVGRYSYAGPQLGFSAPPPPKVTGTPANANR